jgi:large subunit ribosomal protein L4
MASIPVYDAFGSKTRDIEVELDSIDAKVRKPLLKEALIAFLASQRQGTHSTKTRSEVAGGGHKPWKQKGTGRARQGTTRAVQWVGGGRAHGPKPRDYSYRLPTKQRRLALRSALRHRIEEGKLIAVEGLEDQLYAKPSTKAVAAFLKAVGIEGKGALLVSAADHQGLYLSGRNIPKVAVVARRDLSAGPLLQKPNLIVSAAAIEALLAGESAEVSA